MLNKPHTTQNVAVTEAERARYEAAYKKVFGQSPNMLCLTPLRPDGELLTFNDVIHLVAAS